MNSQSLPEGYKKNPLLHAYLFVSADVSARHNTAKLMAKSMLCRNPADTAEPCGKCDCCIKMQASTHPDCIYVSGSEKTSVKDVRKIEDEAYLAPNEADSKVFILEDADEYNEQSQNALLKIIEEPPKGVKFILTASSVGALLPTVRSRVYSLSSDLKNFAYICDEIRTIKKGLDDYQVKALACFVEGYDKADIKTINEALIFDSIDKAHLLLSGKDKNILVSLPKKKEDLLLCLQVFMLCLRQLAITKASGEFSHGILSEAHFSECNAKTSMKKTHALYDMFEKAYLLTQNNANVNAVRAFLLENAK